jgi:hypothetical protein
MEPDPASGDGVDGAGTGAARLLPCGARTNLCAIALAEANVALAEALLENSFIRSPVTGTILRRHGAAQAAGNLPPAPVAVVGDLSHLRVRAEVDETDVRRAKRNPLTQISLGPPRAHTVGRRS